MLRLLPRKTHSVEIIPNNQLEPDTDNELAWWVEGTTPYFDLHSDADLFGKGWLYIEGTLHRYSLSKARLYYDDGNGFTDDNSFVIPVTRRGYIRELVCLPAGVVRLRWAPMDSTGFFVQQGLLVTRIGCLEATLRAVYRVFFDLKRFLLSTERRPAAIETLLKPLLRFKLWEAYRNTIAFRVFDSTPRTTGELWATYSETLQRSLPLIESDYNALPSNPLITIIIHVSETTHATFERTIQALQRQIYPHWELLLDSDAQTLDTLLSNSHLDKRIRLLAKDAVEPARHAEGRYVVFMNELVQLQPQALFRLVQTFQESNADLIYTDGVLLSEDSLEIVDFICRPSFSPQLLNSFQYINDLLAYDKKFLESLNATLEIQPSAVLSRSVKSATTIVHIPEFLYQVTVSRQDTAPSTPETAANLQRVRLTEEGELRVAIIIPTKNAGPLVQQCVDNLLRTISGIAYEIIIIDHDSNDPASLRYFEDISKQHTVLKYSGDFNFSRINNWAVQQLSGNYSHFLFCNNDVEAIDGGWLETMLGFGQQPDVGVVGAQLLYPDRVHIQHAGVCVGLHGLAEHYGKFLPISFKEQGVLNTGGHTSLTCAHEVSAVTAACMLVRQDAFEKVGGFDNNMAVGFGDVDLCLRIGQVGYRCIYSPGSTLIHHESLTRGKDGGDPHPEDTVFFRRRWNTLLEAGDPFYHPAYSQYSFSWQYADPLPCPIHPNVRVWKRP